MFRNFLCSFFAAKNRNDYTPIDDDFNTMKTFESHSISSNLEDCIVNMKAALRKRTITTYTWLGAGLVVTAGLAVGSTCAIKQINETLDTHPDMDSDEIDDLISAGAFYKSTATVLYSSAATIIGFIIKNIVRGITLDKDDLSPELCEQIDELCKELVIDKENKTFNEVLSALEETLKQQQEKHAPKPVTI